MQHDVVIVGLGKIGMEYDLDHSKDFILSHARAFDLHKGFNIVAAVDTSSKKCSVFKSKYGEKLKTYIDLSIALKNVKASIFVIATPTDSHYKIINNILDNSDPLVILCEKPISHNMDQAKKIIAKCKKKKCKLYVNYFRRSDIGVGEIIKKINDKSIQDPVRGVVWYSKGLYNSASHFINILQFIFGSIQTIQVLNKGRLWNNKDPEPDFQLTFNKLKIDFIALKEENYFHNSMEIMMTNGRLSYQRGGAYISWQNVTKNNIFSEYNSLNDNRNIFQSDFSKIQWHVVEQIYKGINGELVTICSGDDALKTLDICNKIKKLL